ncbi:hypothetical protein BKA69DRAFT_1129526 [Paraphysoderma sedebokerense]|nr:hypothetical protein BKA69DRAFT_1129526 [Paraphysoderma sedebokerense]
MAMHTKHDELPGQGVLVTSRSASDCVMDAFSIPEHVNDLSRLYGVCHLPKIRGFFFSLILYTSPYSSSRIVISFILHEKNGRGKDFIRKKFTEYPDRAEKLKDFLGKQEKGKNRTKSDGDGDTDTTNRQKSADKSDGENSPTEDEESKTED